MYNRTMGIIMNQYLPRTSLPIYLQELHILFIRSMSMDFQYKSYGPPQIFFLLYYWLLTYAHTDTLGINHYFFLDSYRAWMHQLIGMESRIPICKQFLVLFQRETRLERKPYIDLSQETILLMQYWSYLRSYISNFLYIGSWDRFVAREYYN